MGYAWGAGDFVPHAAEHNMNMLDQEASMHIQNAQQQGQRYCNNMEQRIANARQAEQKFNNQCSQVESDIQSTKKEIVDLRDKLHCKTSNSSRDAQEIEELNQRISQLRTMIQRARNHLNN